LVRQHVADKAVADNLIVHTESGQHGELASWDLRWMWWVAYRGCWSVTSPVNLCRNVGFRPDASHLDVDDYRAMITSAPAVPLQPDSFLPQPDETYDRHFVLTDYLVGIRRPAWVRRLAQSASLRATVGNERTALYLDAFAYANESVAALRQQRKFGVSGPAIDELEAELTLAAQSHSTAAPTT
jgi:hypothetical protein